MEALAPDDTQEIAGYRLRARLGEGGMGVVYLSHTRGGQPVALKAVRREYAQDPEFRKRFTQEVAAARRVQGPYTAPVLDSFTDGPEPWLAVGYVPGPSLAAAVHQHGVLPVRTALQLTAGIAEALQTIHAAGVIHRDLKPSNVLLASDGPRVIDFGIARAADTTALTGTDVRLGTPAYMAPEQAVGGAVTPALDVFALGLITYFAATGRHPFGDGSSHALLYRIVSTEPDLTACPEELRGIVAACLGKDPTARPTPDQIIEACHDLAGAEGLMRHEGWWLPQAVVEQIAEQERTMRFYSSAAAPSGALPPQAPPAPVSTQPGLSPEAAFAAAAPTRPASAPGAVSMAAAPTAPSYPPQSAPLAEPASAAPAPRRRRTPLLASIAAGVLVIGGGSVAAYRMLGDDNGTDNSSSASGGAKSGSAGGGSPKASAASVGAGASAGPDAPKTEAGWQISVRNKNLVLRAPKFTATAKDVGSGTLCSPSDVTTLDLDDLSVSLNDAYLPTSGQWLTYTDCPDPIKGNGIHLADESGAFNVTTQERPTPTQCRDTAREATLANPVPLSRIRNGSVLKTGTGLCIESSEGPVIHLWITKVGKDPSNDDLPTYVVTATQWKPE
ncbi:serine/threonine-protein kinase [Streptomyces sp. HUAS TT20]|uniref:serine/threonine-protein kinase n=1 Tax=Streptomyces sp. HUAS TT20 TaxID=3447509 RepID=UPI0021D9A48D|nr:serine/threonine-protein kinase [Streptomyces sp. HUAS 15-9]UXY29191.1 serine/threonine protein kinase [Streptomyces sp. HUAS 15-9]